MLWLGWQSLWLWLSEQKLYLALDRSPPLQVPTMPPSQVVLTTDGLLLAQYLGGLVKAWLQAAV